MDTPLISPFDAERELTALQRRIDAAYLEIDAAEAEMGGIVSQLRQQWCWFPQPEPAPPARRTFLVHGFGVPVPMDADN
jgi:hypothetical protein